MKNKKIDIIFASSSNLAVELFNNLINNSTFNVKLVISMPDKPKSRGKKVLPNEFVQFLQSINFPEEKILKPNKLSEIKTILKNEKFDLGILYAYGKILPSWLLTTPKFGWLNFHPSLLPQARGATPIQYSILNLNEGGLSVIYMIKSLDAGGIFFQEKFNISINTDFYSYVDKINSIIPKTINKIVESFSSGFFEFKPQSKENISYSKKLTKQDGKIDFNNEAVKILRIINAYKNWPIAFTFFKNKKIQILEANVVEKNFDNIPVGCIANINPFLIQTKNNCIEILKLKPAGKREMDIKSFANGYKPKIGEKFYE